MTLEKYHMLFASFNINGLRAAIGNGLLDFLANLQADIILLQETKLVTPIDLPISGYRCAWNFSQRSGYAGTAILFRKNPLEIHYGFTNTNFNNEGRIITLEYPSFFVVNVYVPNSQGYLRRWYYRLDWDAALLEYLAVLYTRKPIILGGDFNVAHNYLDIYPENQKNIENQTGFRAEERGGFDKLLELGFVDTFRFLHPNDSGFYTWWSGKNENRKYNRGRRIDYFIVSDTLKSKIQESSIVQADPISDHAPIKLVMGI
ncbi:MAG: exodeoxyribonuclease III [Holosporaceae bacterium]|nr:exodeoxyribonuclease III [Holosporaceae bacterium]